MDIFVSDVNFEQDCEEFKFDTLKEAKKFCKQDYKRGIISYTATYGLQNIATCKELIKSYGYGDRW